MIVKVIDLYYLLPNIQLGEAMILAGFSDDEYDNIVLPQRQCWWGCWLALFNVKDATKSLPWKGGAAATEATATILETWNKNFDFNQQSTQQ